MIIFKTKENRNQNASEKKLSVTNELRQAKNRKHNERTMTKYKNYGT